MDGCTPANKYVNSDKYCASHIVNIISILIPMYVYDGNFIRSWELFMLFELMIIIYLEQKLSILNQSWLETTKMKHKRIELMIIYFLGKYNL